MAFAYHINSEAHAFRSGTQALRAESAAGNTLAQAEIVRRSLSGKSGYVRESLRGGVKPAFWGAKAKPAVKPQPAPAFAYTKPEVAMPVAARKGRDTLRAVRGDLGARLDAIDHALAQQGKVLTALARKLGA